jgi:hypothetical protein
MSKKSENSSNKLGAGHSDPSRKRLSCTELLCFNQWQKEKKKSFNLQKKSSKVLERLSQKSTEFIASVMSSSSRKFERHEAARSVPHLRCVVLGSMVPSSCSLCQNGCLWTQSPPVLHSSFSKCSGLLSGGSPCWRHGSHRLHGARRRLPRSSAPTCWFSVSASSPRCQQLGGSIWGWVWWTRVESIWGNRCALLRDKACSGWCPCCHWRRGSLSIGNSQQWFSILWARLVIGGTT